MSTITTTATISTPKKGPRGSNRQPKRTRFTGRDSKPMKVVLNLAENLKQRKLTSNERGACAFLSAPYSSAYSSGR